MQELQGSVKESAYANCIRDYVLYQLKNLNNSELEEKNQKLIAAIKKQKKAKIIIKAFVNAFKQRKVKSVALDFLTYESKFTQKEILSFDCRAVTINENLKDDEYEIERYKTEEEKQENKQDVKNVFIPATNTQIEYLKDLFENLDENKINYSSEGVGFYQNKFEKYKENKLSKKEASSLIKTLLNYQKTKTRKNCGVRYFECKYDTYDCETSEHISKGELVWKDNEGIHRADNY